MSDRKKYSFVINAFGLSFYRIGPFQLLPSSTLISLRRTICSSVSLFIDSEPPEAESTRSLITSQRKMLSPQANLMSCLKTPWWSVSNYVGLCITISLSDLDHFVRLLHIPKYFTIILIQFLIKVTNRICLLRWIASNELKLQLISSRRTKRWCRY